MDITKILEFADTALHPRELTQEEYQAAYANDLQNQTFLQPDAPTRRRAQQTAYPNMKSNKWWKYPLLNQTLTRELPKLPLGPKQFGSIKPVLLTREQLLEKNKTDRRIQDKELLFRRNQIKDPIGKAMQYLRDTFNPEAY